MTWVFIAALLFGGGLITMGLLGKDTDHDGVSGDHDVGFLALFSLRNLAWASFAFGGIGLLAVATQRSLFVTLASSIGLGLATMGAVHLIFRALKAGEVGTAPSNLAALGASAELVLPFDADGLGAVVFRAGGQQHEMPARRADEVASLDASHFSVCRIEWIDAGVAVVTPVA